MASAKPLSTGKLEKTDFGSGFEESLAVAKSSKADRVFDTIIGHIENIIMEDEFQRLQNDFMEKHYLTFDNKEENKLVYTDIHNEYTQLIETFLESELCKRMPGFSMNEFQKQLVSRRNELDGEVFEILLTFSDFLSFKELILDYRAAKEGTCLGLDNSLTVLHLKESPVAALSSASECHSILPRPEETTAAESSLPSSPDHVNQKICLPVQNMSLESDFGLCISGSNFKSCSK